MAKSFESSYDSVDVTHMSERQQTLYLLNMTRSDSTQSVTRNIDADIEDLNEWFEELKLRDRKANPKKQAERQAYMEEAGRYFKPMKRSLYLERKPMRVSANDAMVCTCKSPYLLTEGLYAGQYTRGCGRRCLNRLLCTECVVETCAAREMCTNRVFQLQQHCNVYPIKTEKCGWGLAAGQPIPRGTFIIQYIGEIFSVDSEIGRKRIEKYRGSPCVYLMSTSQNEVIDPTNRGNLARFINHCCEPNSETQKWNVLGEICIGIFAKRDIAEDEELTFDYRFDAHKTAFTKCLCGAAKCRKYLGYIGTDINIDRPRRGHTACDKCGENERNQELVKCTECARCFHMNCSDPPLKKTPKAGWLCELCRPANLNSLKEWKAVVTRRTLDVIRHNLEELTGLDTKIFWKRISADEEYEITLRGNDVSKAKEKVEAVHRSPVTMLQPSGREVGEVELRVPVCFVRQLASSFNRYRQESHVFITFDRSVVGDALDICTSLILTGYMSAINAVAQELTETLEALTVLKFELLADEVECSLAQLELLKADIFPVELHFSPESFKRPPTSPLTPDSALLCRGVLIGEQSSVEAAYSAMQTVISKAQQGGRKFSHIIFVSAELQSQVEANRTTIMQHFQPLTLRIEKLAPDAEVIGVSMIGTWKQCMAIEHALVDILYGAAGPYQEKKDFRDRQLIRYMLKEATRYLYFRSHRKLSRRPFVMKYWDLQTTTLLSPTYTERETKLAKAVLEHNGALFYFLSLAEEQVYQEWFAEAGDLMEVASELLGYFRKFLSLSVDSPDRLSYDNSVFNDYVSTYLVEEQSSELDLHSIIHTSIEEVRRDSDFHEHFARPLSYVVSLNGPHIELAGRMASVLNSIGSMKLIQCFGKNAIQKIETKSVPIDVREKADLVVSCQNDPRNYLYVAFNRT
jgi:hypothetical protein